MSDAELKKMETGLSELKKGSALPDTLVSPDGKKNIYTCRSCRGHIVTRDTEAGVTPFMIRCEATAGCSGMMHSSFYRVFDGTIAASHEWFKPNVAQVIEPGVRRHVEKGGLVLRKIAT